MILFYRRRNMGAFKMLVQGWMQDVQHMVL